MFKQNLESNSQVEVIIPTRNDVKFLGKIVNQLKSIKEILCIHIVNNLSTAENTELIKGICLACGLCRYHDCKEVGKGAAIRAALQHIDNDTLFLDADIENFSINMVVPLLEELKKGKGIVKANFIRSNGQSNSAFIIKEIRDYFPGLNSSRPCGGIYCVSREALEQICIPSSWNVDVSILLQIYLKGFRASEIFIGRLKDKKRSWESLLESKECLTQEIEKVRRISKNV